MTLINRQSIQKRKLNLAFRLTAAALFVASCTLSSWQQVQADPNLSEFDVNGVTTDVYGTAGTGYTGADVRQSDSSPTGQGPQAMEKELTPNYTTKQNLSRTDVPYAGMPVTSSDPTRITQFAQLDKKFGGGLDKLPATRLDSFVAQAGGQAEFIYGDEGVFDIPPLFGFTGMSRINAGINSGGLTTDHKDGSLPEAWGYPQ